MRHFAVLCIAGLVIAGCSQAGDPIVGTWTGTSTVSGMSANMEMTYGADGTFKGTVVAKVPNQGSFTITNGGKWEYDSAKKLKVTVSSVDMKTEGMPPQVEAMFKASNTPDAKAKLMKDINAEPAQAITWNGNDEFTTQSQGQTVTFKRKK
ncbi:MAG: hypothetical protein JNK63_03980 [Chthonomonas sp.]|mgnify:CR=1 FL=1|nr:hypothetical protein [Chthonomonas sp.]